MDELKIERITDEELAQFSDSDLRAAYLYYLMNRGYTYDEKIIKEEASDEAGEVRPRGMAQVHGALIEARHDAEEVLDGSCRVHQLVRLELGDGDGHVDFINGTGNVYAVTIVEALRHG